jgi:hypothetical protein
VALLWLAWWLLAFLVGASFTDASAMGLVLSLQGLVGCAAISAVGLGSNLNAIRLLGLGTAVGAAVTTLLLQLLLLLVGGVSPLFFTIGMALVAFVLLTKGRDQVSVERTDAMEIGTVLLAALVSLGLTTGWHLLHVVALGSTLVITGFAGRKRRLTSRLVKSMMIFGPLILLSWWFRETVDQVLLSRILWDGDNSIFQLLINTTERWGVLENVGASGQSPIIGYHWATFGWMAMLEGAANAAPWVTLQFVMPVVASIVVSSMLWEIATSVSKSTVLRLAVIVAAMCLFFRPDGSVSLFVSDVWLIAFALIAYIAMNNSRLFRSLPLVAIVFAGVLLGKRSTGVLVIAAVLAVTVLAFGVRQRRMAGQFAVISLTTICVLVLDQLIAEFSQRFAGVDLNDLTSGAGRVRFEFISDEAFGYAGTFTGVLSVLGALFVSLSIFFPQMAALLVQFLRNGSSSAAFVGILSSVLVSVAVPFVMTGEVLAVYFYSRHLGLVMGSILVLVVALRMLSAWEMGGESTVWRRLLLVAVFSSVMWLLLFEILQRHSEINWTIVKDAGWIPTLTSAILMAVFVPSLRKRESFLGYSILSSVIVIGVVAAPKFVDELTNERIKPLISGSFTYDDLDLPTTDVNEVGNWIRTNTPVDSVIGSNYFCENRSNFNLDCTPQSWWRDWLSRANELDAFDTACQVETSEVLGRVQNYLLPAVSDRRFFIQGPGFSLGCSQPPEWITERVTVSESFARDPDSESCSKLREAGVEFFVVDRRTTVRDTWGGFARERMANDSFRVLELREDSCSEI